MTFDHLARISKVNMVVLSWNGLADTLALHSGVVILLLFLARKAFRILKHDKNLDLFLGWNIILFGTYPK